MEYILEQALWLSFALLGTLVMQNTLVAMMNNTCNDIEDESLVSACGGDLKKGPALMIHIQKMPRVS